MTNPAIPAEAVEAAARGLARHKWPTAIGVWESFGQGMQDDFRDQARPALEAAAPYLRAQALEELAHFFHPSGVLWWGDSGVTVAEPGRPTRWTKLTDWLRARAVAERGGE